MAESVLKADEISLNGVRYPIVGGVQRTLVSNFPPKQVIGEWTQESDPNLSTLVLSDHRGGIGLDVMGGQGDTNRSWYSTATLRYKNRLILPPLRFVTTIAAGIGVPSAIRAMVEFKGSIYAYFDATANGIFSYSDSGDSWGSILLTVTGITDSISGNIGGTDTLVFCDGSNYYYSTTGAGASFTPDTQNATYLAIWDDKLFGIDAATGQLWYVTAAGGTVVNDAKLILGRAAELTGLMIGPNAAGEPIIYAITSRGLYAHDFDNGKFILTGMQVPNKTTASYTAQACACTWRGKIYYSSDSSLYEYDVTRGLIRPIGPDQDGGLPATYGVTFNQLQGSLNELIAVAASSNGSIGIVLGWDEQGWQILYQQTGLILSTILVSGAYGAYRLWLSDEVVGTVYYLSIPSNLINPLRLSTYLYGTAATHDWPWFVPNFPAVAVRLKVETLNPSTDETVTISYATNLVESFTALTAITTAGETTFLLPTTASPTGLAFKSIRFRAALARGSTTTSTPQVIKLTLKYYEKLDAKYQFIVTPSIGPQGYGKSAKELEAALLTAQETNTLVEFTYRDSGADTNATFYVQVRPQVAEQHTGHDYSGKTQLLLVEM